MLHQILWLMQMHSIIYIINLYYKTEFDGSFTYFMKLVFMFIIIEIMFRKYSTVIDEKQDRKQEGI